MKHLAGSLLALGAMASVVAAACSTPPADSRIGIDAPSRAQFDPVGGYLEHRCGSLDCHGSIARNMRIYGCNGLRLSGSDSPGCASDGFAGPDTTQAELDATYRSVVALEPTVMSAVVDGNGEHPEWLTLVRKARGMENHKGGALITPGDPQDVCITSWLAGNTDSGACLQATNKYP